MKKILLLTVLSVFTFISCDTDDDRHIYNGDDLAYFDATDATFLVTSDNPSFQIKVLTTTLSDVDKTYTVSVVEVVDDALPAAGLEAVLATTTVTIAAGQYFSNVTINGNFDAASETGSRLNLVLTDATGKVAGFKNTFALDVFKLCESNLAGVYNVTTTYGFHDFLPDYQSNTIEGVVITSEGGNVYSVTDFSGGLYSVGPYAAAYGTGAADNSLTFSDICGNIAWTGQTDPWGSISTDGVNSVDLETGVITISWIADFYGETGVSIYTPQ
jgi:hypothetical protein